MEKVAGKREAVLHAAMRLLNRGVALYDITVQQIATEAGIGKGTVYEYFSSREEILTQTLLAHASHALDVLETRLDAAENAEQKLEVLFDAADNAQADCLPAARMVLSEILRRGDTQMFAQAVEQAGIPARIRCLLAGVAECGVAQGVFRPCVCEQAALVTLVGALRAYMDIVYLIPKADPASLRRDALAMVYKALK